MSPYYGHNNMSVGNLTGAEGARLLGLLLRQVRQLVKRYREGGAAGLAHGNRGRVSGRRTVSGQRAAIVKRLAEGYGNYNTRHLQEVLAERDGAVVSYTSLRALRPPGYLSRKDRMFATVYLPPRSAMLIPNTDARLCFFTPIPEISRRSRRCFRSF